MSVTVCGNSDKSFVCGVLVCGVCLLFVVSDSGSVCGVLSLVL